MSHEPERKMETIDDIPSIRAKLRAEISRQCGRAQCGAQEPCPEPKAQSGSLCSGRFVRALVLRCKRRLKQACLMALVSRGDREINRAYFWLYRAMRPNNKAQPRAGE